MTDKALEAALLPCPFCAATLYKCEYATDGVRWAHESNDCVMSRRFIPFSAIAAWNRRAPVSALPGEAEVVGKIEAIIEAFDADYADELADAQTTGERPDLHPREVDVPVALLRQVAVAFHGAPPAVDLLVAEMPDEDDIEEAISGSIDIDWTPRVAAREVMRLLAKGVNRTGKEGEHLERRCPNGPESDPKNENIDPSLFNLVLSSLTDLERFCATPRTTIPCRQQPRATPSTRLAAAGMVDLIEKLEEAAQWDDSPSQLIHEAIAHIGERDAEVKRLEAKIKDQTSAGSCDAQYLSDGPPYRCGWERRAEAAEARVKELEEERDALRSRIEEQRVNFAGMQAVQDAINLILSPTKGGSNG